MYDVILFGGTTEGRMLAEYLSEAGVNALVCVATPYGDSLLECKSNITVHSGRLDELQMLELFTTERPKLVLDATHPYADIVTKNIRAACEKAGCQYVRIKRESIETEGCACFTSMDELIVPAGIRDYNGNFVDERYRTYFWTASEGNMDDYAWGKCFYYKDSEVSKVGKEKEVGLSLRCVKDSN